MPANDLPYYIAFAAASVAGAVNSVAGGGTLITFPTLLWLGVPPVNANATNTMALWPAALAGAWGFRETKPASKKLLILFAFVSLAGGASGAYLLTLTNNEQFKAIVPWLILMAAVLFLAQDNLAFLKPAPQTETPPVAAEQPMLMALIFQYFVAVYGGYFGAGIGIIMLAALAVMRVGDIYQMNFMKNIGALCVNLSASLVLGIWGLVDWPMALAMAAGALLGGFFGADAAKAIGPRRLRTAISSMAFLIAGYMLFRQFKS